MQWDPNSRRLLTAGPNDEIMVWDGQTGEQLLGPLRMPGGEILFARWSPDGRLITARNDDKKVRVWDASTGEAIMPSLPHTDVVAFAIMVSNTRLLSATYPNLLRAWDMKESPLSPDILADYAKLLSGRRLNAAGVMLVLKPEELAEINRSLCIRAPHLFE